MDPLNSPLRAREDLRIAIAIEQTYQRRLCQGVLGRLTPVKFEMLETEFQAALKL